MPREQYELNGLTKFQPRGARYEKATVPRKKYFSDIRSRLVDEVGVIVAGINARNAKDPQVGFFSMVRIIMPILEAVATSEGKTPQELLSELGIKTPFLTWNVYRDIFLHNDEFAVAHVGRAAVQAGIVFTEDDEDPAAKLLSADGRNCDPMRLRRLLIAHLDDKISSMDEDATVEIINGIEYLAESEEEEVKGGIREIQEIWREAEADGGS